MLSNIQGPDKSWWVLAIGECSFEGLQGIIISHYPSASSFYYKTGYHWGGAGVEKWQPTMSLLYYEMTIF